MNSLLQVERYRLTQWKKMKEAELKNWGKSRLTTIPVKPGHSDFHWMDKKQLLLEKFNKIKKTKDWHLEERTQASIFGEKRFWKSIYVQIVRLKELLAIPFPRFQCRIRVDSVPTHYSSKIWDFSIAAFGWKNQTCSYRDTWNWIKRFFHCGRNFGFLGQWRFWRKERVKY